MNQKKKHEKEDNAGVIPNQPEINIGLIGHVDHGKTTLTERLSGKWTDTHSEEMKRGITIRLGYANSSFYKCPKCKSSAAYGTKDICKVCSSKAKFLRKVSFIDAPGHESLMATMLSGAMIMDAALLLVAANEECPQPQTREHVMALQIIGVKQLIIVQNKIDLVTEEKALKNYEQIKEFLKDTIYKDSPIIPISAQHNLNIDVLIEAILDVFKTPEHDITKKPIMLIARSFDINKPGSDITTLQGGVLGGAVVQGKFTIGDKIEIKPGYEKAEANKKVWKSLTTEITGIMSGEEKIDEAMPGGSIAILTNLDPSIVKSDTLAGNSVSRPGEGYTVIEELELEINLLKRVVGTKQDLDVDPIKMNEILMLNVNSSATVGIVFHLGRSSIKARLKKPVCAEKGQHVTISRMIGSRFRLIGYGLIK